MGKYMVPDLSVSIGLCCSCTENGVQQPFDRRKLVPVCDNSLNTELGCSHVTLKEYYRIGFANKTVAGSVSTLCNPS